MARRFWVLFFGLWLGAGIGISFLAIPEVFAASKTGEVTRLQAGRIAQEVLGRTFSAQYAMLALAAMVHAFGGRRSTPSPGTRFRAVLLTALAVLVLAGGLVLQPVLRSLHRQMYDPAATGEVRDRAAHRFGPLHGVSQIGNLLVLGLVFTGLWQASGIGSGRRPPPSPEADGGRTAVPDSAGTAPGSVAPQPRADPVPDELRPRI